jgi:septin family protein
MNKDQPIVPRIREISSNVGFVSLPDQVHRRAVKKGFEFNLMVVGKIHCFSMNDISDLLHIF